LVLATGSGAAGAVGGPGFGAATGFGAAAGFGAGAIADGGISFLTAGLAAAAALAGFSAAAGLASSSAMMRRIDARISSIEGSWTFAGCVISDSTSKPFYTKPRRICRFRICRPGFSSHKPDLSPDQARPMHRAGSAPPQGNPARDPCPQKADANRPAACKKGMSRQ